MKNQDENKVSNKSYRISPDDANFDIYVLAGALAGLSVDMILFPIDTIKTRLQSPSGFRKSGGFSRIYSGIGSIATGSAPGAAIFFMVYESTKSLLQKNFPSFNENHRAGSYILAASCGEICACLIRVPVEVVKQRAQANQMNSWFVLRTTVKHTGLKGLYRGFSSTLIREIPFSAIQFPLWEFGKSFWSRFNDRSSQLDMCHPYQSMICGSIAGGVAAFLTTPLDVAKTQIMLGNFGAQNEIASPKNYLQTFKIIYSTRGFKGLFSGAIPRSIWISFGGAIFLGGYEKIISLLS
ncbi:S-adenosylmethionine mitochondrial carrier protein-like protein [Sarcoptes scabiei]|uniref:S-adenosylmethionine mitochondrial carrier protein-like protein n=1 Tax=Sarcoptes scabiei TaxID=52283 RepID=A0A131ZY31_SARSC|nr:S-adenosylmethionine mitochondrial carrier protein-like protein [Sarcoptes scabiei]